MINHRNSIFSILVLCVSSFVTSCDSTTAQHSQDEFKNLFGPCDFERITADPIHYVAPWFHPAAAAVGAPSLERVEIKKSVAHKCGPPKADKHCIEDDFLFEPAAFDIVDAELVEHLRDHDLVVQREVDAVGLRAVPQRGVEEIEPFSRHDPTFGHQR